jgi:uncharacterized glyoxalase superfamily protein PhnB
MSDRAASGRQAVVPMISYADRPAAMDWLADVVGFVEEDRMVDGAVLGHGEMLAGRGRIFLATPTPEYEGPKAHREHCARARGWSAVPYVVDGVLVYVEDVDRHFSRARDRGATILSEPQDNPYGRAYRAEDIEGHRWMFLQEPAGA